MKWLAFLFVCLLAPLVQAQTLDKDALLQSIRDTRSAEQAAMQAREQQFLRERDQQQQRLAQARARLAQAQARARRNGMPRGSPRQSHPNCLPGTPGPSPRKAPSDQS